MDVHVRSRLEKTNLTYLSIFDYPKKDIEYIAIFSTQKNKKIPKTTFMFFY